MDAPPGKSRQVFPRALNAHKTEFETGRPPEVPFLVATRALVKAPEITGCSEVFSAPGGLFRALANPSNSLHSSTVSSRDFSHGSVETVDSGPGGMSTLTGNPEVHGRNLSDGVDIDPGVDTAGKSIPLAPKSIPLAPIVAIGPTPESMAPAEQAVTAERWRLCC